MDKPRYAVQLESVPPGGSAQASLASTDLLSLAIEHSPAAVAVLDRSARYLMTSERWLSDFGLTASALLGREHFEIWPHTSKEWAAAFLRSLGGSVEQLEEAADGSADPVRWVLRPWHSAAGDVAGTMVIAEKFGEQLRIQ
ncbi:MAG TPA: PAS domain-containing protein, partial [Polyangiales bacterium]|nr:PAS domain-containing protein [Polyangiales bacterium]